MTTAPVVPFNAAAAQAAALSEIAAARQSGNRGTLTVDTTLSQVASSHTGDMVKHNYFSHIGSDGSLPYNRAAAAGYWSLAQEVIARGKPGDDIVGALLKDATSGPALTAWGLQRIGVSAQQDPKTGQVIWTIELGWG